MIAEDLPDVIEAVVAGRRAELGFFEQGCARSVQLEPAANGVVLVSGGEVHFGGRPWQPHQPCPTDTPELARMLQDLVTAFADMLVDLNADLAHIPDFRDWRTPRN